MASNKKRKADTQDETSNKEQKTGDTKTTDDVTSQIKSIWSKLEEHLAKVKSPILELLNKPATDDDFKKFEEKFKRPVPAELRAFYSVHNGQKLNHEEGDEPQFPENTALFSSLSDGVGLCPIEQWNTHLEPADIEQFAENVVEPTDQDKQKPGDRIGDGVNSIASGWISFARSYNYEESRGYFYAYAVEGAKPDAKKDEGEKKKKKADSPLTENQVLKWDFQYETLSECRLQGTFVPWFEKVTDDLIKRITEAEPEPTGEGEGGGGEEV